MANVHPPARKAVPVLGVMIAAAVVIVLLVAWAAWHGAQSANDILAITPSVVRPEVPVPNLPRGPVVPNPPIPAPQ